MKKRKLRFAPFLWISAYIIIIDIAINVIFPYPKDPRNISPSAMQHFFEYGRSVEGKLTRMTRKTNDESAPILSAGWLDDSSDKLITKNPNNPNNPVVTIYGMSHAILLAEDMARIDSSLMIRSIGAPGGVPSWSYAAYLFDKEHHHSDVVILGIMTRGVPLISTTSGATNHFDSISPYTYPRFFLSNGTLNFVLPPFISLEGYREYFYNSEKWKSYINWLHEYDKYYDPLLFKKSILDSSSIFRMLRRAYAYSMTRKHESKVYTDTRGFDAESDEVKILRSIVVEFSQTARRDNSLPIIYIVNNVFMSDRLFRILEPTLLSHNVLFLSSHDICPPNDPRNYDSTSHFIPSINLDLAKAMIRIIRENVTLKAANKETKVQSP
jgi:hypothetical protein